MTRHNEVLMTTEELAGRLDDRSLALVEVDEDTTAYDKGHIAGAVGLDWVTDLHAAPRRDFIGQKELAELLADRGISSEQTIVLYGGNNNWFAAYAYWLFRYRGIDQVRLLDGGRKKWELERRPLVQDVPDRPAATFEVTGTERPELRIFRDDVLERLRTGMAGFVDVRSPEEFRGELLAPAHLPQEQAQVPGHIPGATNVPWSKAANDDGTFRPVEQLTALYEGAGITPDREIVAYCRIGERSAHTWFVLAEMLGYPDVRNYDGSWTEYGSLVGAPVER